MFYQILLISSVCCVALSQQSYHQQSRNDNFDRDHQPLPYNFGYAFKDENGAQFRKEHGDGHGQVQGSYGFTDERGVQREVHYIADHNGFRAQVKSNEPGMNGRDPADVSLHYNGHPDSGFHGFQHFQG